MRNRILHNSFSILIVLLFIINFANAQAEQSSYFNGQINGLVIDKDNHSPIEYATIIVYKKGAIKPMEGATTNAKGEFAIKGLDTGVYRVEVEFISYTSFQKSDLVIDQKHAKIMLGQIQLQKNSNQLKDVVVNSSARLIENKIDKIVYNAEKDISGQVGVATDILKKIPQVSVDIDGNVQLSGTSSIRFLINGRPSTAYGSNISEVLQSIPASEIKSVEVLTSPGAKYDANGLGGIINIILKNNKAKGYNGTVNTSVGTLLENGSVNLTARKNSFGVNFNFSANKRLKAITPSTFTKTTIDSVNQQFHYLNQQGENQFERQGYHSGVNFDWNPSKKNAFTLNIANNNFGMDASGFNNQLFSAQLFGANMISQNSSFHNLSSFASRINGYDYGGTYKRTFNKADRELELVYNGFTENTSYKPKTLQTDQITSAIVYGTNNENIARNKESEFELNYTEPISDKIKWNTGAKWIYTENQNTNTVFNLGQQGIYVPNNSLSSAVHYQQEVIALYSEVNMPLNATIDMKLGGRYERTNINALYSSASTKVNPDYYNVVPSIFFIKKIGDDNIKLSYSRRINRPGYEDLNPYFNTTDPKNISTGNPNLLPEHGERIELAFNKKMGAVGNFSLVLFQRNSSQDIQPYTYYYASYKIGDTVFTNVSISSPNNIGLEKNTGLNLYGDVNFTKALEVRGNISYYHRDIYNSIDKNRNAHSENYRMNLNATYEFSKQLVMEAFGNFTSARNEVQGKYPSNINYSLAFKRRFWNNKASVGLVAINPFAEHIKQQVLISGSNFYSNNTRWVPSRSFGLSFSYKFGKLEFKKENKSPEVSEEGAN